MHASYSGTLTEQQRFRMGWLKCRERKRKGILSHCGSCEHISGNNRCSKGDFATRVGCFCDEFKKRAAVEP